MRSISPDKLAQVNNARVLKLVTTYEKLKTLDTLTPAQNDLYITAEACLMKLDDIMIEVKNLNKQAKNIFKA
jgi:hypothetical protein